MNKLKQVLEDILKKEESFLDLETGELNYNKVKDSADRIDQKLIALLIENKEVKEKFFTKIKDVYVFNINDFKFFLDENKINNSYTQYSNKIGLSDNIEFLSDRTDVVLDFPFKDCVLEGGQSTEEGTDVYFEYSDKDKKYEEKEAKRNEIFFNQILAHDEIDRLFDKKALVNWKRFTKESGEKGESVKEIKRDKDGLIKENLIIKGNNLIALHSLKSEFARKIKLIYIDPPYNTGNDEFKYNDSFNHSTWLTFMKNRLEIARELLSDDGSIYVQIDNNESHYLKIIMDEVFGRNNFQREIIWVLKGVSGYKSLINNFVRGHETILFYTKTNNFKFNKVYLPYSKEQLARFSSEDENGKKYKTITKERKLYLEDAKGIPTPDVWDDISSFQTIVNSPEITGFSTQKPEKLVQRIIESATDKNDIVLDFQLGSGTTCAVAHKMGRQYVGIEQMDYIKTITCKRLKKTIDGEQSGISKSVDWNGGGSFIYCELAKWNEQAKEEINEAKDLNALEKMFDNLYKKYFLNYNVKVKEFREKVIKEENFKKLTLDEQKRMFLTMLDLNQMYVQESEMADKQFNISKEDQKLTKDFYQNK